LRLDLLAGYAEEFGSLSDPGTHYVFTLAIVIVGGIVVTEPLGAIAHFSHRPHWGRRLAKSPFRRQPSKKGLGAETQYAKFWHANFRKQHFARIWRILCSFSLFGRFLAFLRFSMLFGMQ
jgi:hypothetical protein